MAAGIAALFAACGLASWWLFWSGFEWIVGAPFGVVLAVLTRRGAAAVKLALLSAAIWPLAFWTATYLYAYGMALGVVGAVLAFGITGAAGAAGVAAVASVRVGIPALAGFLAAQAFVPWSARGIERHDTVAATIAAVGFAVWQAAVGAWVASLARSKQHVTIRRNHSL